MVTIPVTILDNFLENPNSIRDWGLSLPYHSDSEHKVPGKRTNCLSQLHYPLFNYINRKVLSLFYENLVEYECALHFQLIEEYQGEGWIHQDQNLFTFIIYLSEENEINCGTSLYNLKPNKFHYINSSTDYDNLLLRNHHHKIKKPTTEIESIQNQDLKLNYEKNLDIKDKYNRLLCFSSEQLHKANNFSNNTSPRLTLIGFVNKISSCNPPVIRSKQTLMM
jgi:hypothetical protein